MRMSLPVVRQSEALLDEEQSRKITNRLSDQSVSSNKSKESFKDHNDLLSKRKKDASLKNGMKLNGGKNRKKDMSITSNGKTAKKKGSVKDEDSDDSMNF